VIVNHRACGFCTEFTIGDKPTGACRQGNPGNAGTTVHATQRPCVLYRRAFDVTKREKFVAKYKEAEPA
jgi:hypothetical protein